MKKVIILSLFFLVSLNGYNQVEQIKALMVYRIANHIEFKGTKSNGDFIIGVKDNTKVLEILSALAREKKVGTRLIIVKSISDAGDAKECNIVYVPSIDVSDFERACKKGKTLLCSEEKGTCNNGAGISLYISDGKPNFEISESNLNSCGITPSSELLKMGEKN